jgi:hypothetical protein
VLAANKAYSQPVNLLQSYQTGQFTTVQAVLVDNSLVAYPVTIFSRSTGQRVVVGPYTQQMTPLLVSVAPEFLITLNVPIGVVARDQVQTQFWFLNTPQAPYATTTIPPGEPGSATSGEQIASGTTSFNQTVTDVGSPPYPVATLMAGFPAGTKTATYVVTVVTVTVNVGSAFFYNLNVRTMDGANILTIGPSTQPVNPGQTGLVFNYRNSYSGGDTVNTSGTSILLQLLFSSGPAGPFPVNLSIGYSFAYTLI